MGLYREYQKTADHQAVAAEARSLPGTWVRLGTYRGADTARHIAYVVRHGRWPAYAPGGAFQVWRTLADDQRTVWVRYVDGRPMPLTVLPEELPEPARLAMEVAGHRELFVSGSQAARLLDERGYPEEAAAVRALIRARGASSTGAVQAAIHLMKLSATRKEPAQ
ncbi:hypothetical protein [Streptomyces sp. 049-1]|uniref:hypothetical protein n=1 Tax=Streptomyces sp. 049-1 TaxID=2789264 RepID=UPI00397F9FB4